MLGCHRKLMTHVRHDVHALVNIHCIAHQEALSACDGLQTIPKLLVLDQFANKLTYYS
jgi:hypothetical protein